MSMLAKMFVRDSKYYDEDYDWLTDSYSTHLLLSLNPIVSFRLETGVTVSLSKPLYHNDIDTGDVERLLTGVRAMYPKAKAFVFWYRPDNDPDFPAHKLTAFPIDRDYNDREFFHLSRTSAPVFAADIRDMYRFYVTGIEYRLNGE